MKQKKASYSLEFKLQAVHLVKESGQSMAEVAIAPQQAGDEAERVGPRALTTDRVRLEPPLTPIWGRTYGH